MSGTEGLKRLLEGNERFAAGRSTCVPVTSKLAELAQSQEPFAIVLGCSDSRVPIEVVFDQEPGSIFVVRIAGNYATTDGIGSIEYGVSVLHASLLMVLGHSSCGAVTAAVEYVKNGKTFPGHIQALAEAIAPAARAAERRGNGSVEAAIRENVHETLHALQDRSPIIGDAVKSGKLDAVGGMYELHSGRVTILS
jgi:carbonic anhydrase